MSSLIDSESKIEGNQSDTSKDVVPEPESAAWPEHEPAARPEHDSKPESPTEGSDVSKPKDATQSRDWRFYMVFAALAVTGLSSIEATIISTALPTIIHNLNVGSNYAWVANSYMLTRSVRSPFFPLEC